MTSDRGISSQEPSKYTSRILLLQQLARSFPAKSLPNTPPEYYCCSNLLGPEFIPFKFHDEFHLYWLEHTTDTNILNHSLDVIYVISKDMIFSSC